MHPPGRKSKKEREVVKNREETRQSLLEAGEYGGAVKNTVLKDYEVFLGDINRWIEVQDNSFVVLRGTGSSTVFESRNQYEVYITGEDYSVAKLIQFTFDNHGDIHHLEGVR